MHRTAAPGAGDLDPMPRTRGRTDLAVVAAAATSVVVTGVTAFGVWLQISDWYGAPAATDASSALTVNPAKAPWYHLQLLEVLVIADLQVVRSLAPAALLVGCVAAGGWLIGVDALARSGCAAPALRAVRRRVPVAVALVLAYVCAVILWAGAATAMGPWLGIPYRVWAGVALAVPAALPAGTILLDVGTLTGRAGRIRAGRALLIAWVFTTAVLGGRVLARGAG